MATKQSNPADKVEQWDITKLVPYARNSRTHSDAQVAQIAASIKEWGWTTPVLVDEDGSIIAGHGRTLAAQRLKMTQVPVMVAKGWSDTKKRAYIIADNKLALNAGWDDEMLKIELSDLLGEGFDVELTGFTLAEISALGLDEQESENAADGESPNGNLSDRFMIPPFSVLNAREGWWQSRKKAWLAIGIKSELGRGGGAGTPPHPPTVTKNRDGTLNYSGTAGQDARFDRQRQAAAPGPRATTAKSSAATARGGR